MIFSSKISRHKKILSNFSYLTALDVFLLIGPLITYPYLTRTLGLNLYGWVIAAQVTASYCTVLIDFGFKRISARHIANSGNDLLKMSETVSSILILRLILWIISFVIYISVVLAIDSYRTHLILFIYSFLTTLSSVLFLDFYFQGTENMKYITIINIAVRSIFIIATFVVINEPSDYLYVPLLWGIGYILGGAISMWVVFRKHGLKFHMPTHKVLKMHMKEGSIIFFSDAMLTIKDKLNYNIMGAMIGMSDIVIYDIGSRISGLLQKPSLIFCTVLFPRMAKKPSVSNAKKMMLLLLSLSVILCALINVVLPYIVKFFIDEDIDLWAIRLFSLAPVILSVSGYISSNVFFAFGFDKYILKSTYIHTIGYVLVLGFMYLNGMLNSVASFVFLTVFAYFIELIYRLILTNTIFKTYKQDNLAENI